MRFVLIALALTLSPVAAFAGQCANDVALIETALQTTTIDAEQKQEVMDLRDQAIQLCGAGNDEQGLDQTAQAKQILGVE
jgi:hypothetical protein